VERGEEIGEVVNLGGKYAQNRYGNQYLRSKFAELSAKSPTTLEKFWSHGIDHTMTERGGVLHDPALNRVATKSDQISKKRRIVKTDQEMLKIDEKVRERFIKELNSKINNGSVKSKKQFEAMKVQLSKKFRIDVPKTKNILKLMKDRLSD